MHKRYQVFVSSTYTDLIDEREKVFHTLMEMGCIPAGMELFSAADEDQFEFIKKVIDDCDYYLLIIGGRYGSLAEDKISFTEKEFNYAISIGLKVVVLIHKNPDSIPSGKTDQNPKLKKKLEAFKAKAMDGRMVAFWEDVKDLSGCVSINITKAIRMYPAQGWVRGGQVASQEILEEINNLRKMNGLLDEQLQSRKVQSSLEISNLISFDEEHKIELKYRTAEYEDYDFYGDTEYTDIKKHKKTITLTWKEIFMMLADDFLYEKSDGRVQKNLASVLADSLKIKNDRLLVSSSVTSKETKTVLNQFMAYGLIDYRLGKKNTYLNWFLTPKGKKCLLENRAILTKQE